MKENCWEFKNCRFAAGADKMPELGVCAAYTEQRLNGVHGGTNAGRACWVVAGTMCDGAVQEGYSVKISGCRACDFFHAVNREEGPNALKTITMLDMLA